MPWLPPFKTADGNSLTKYAKSLWNLVRKITGSPNGRELALLTFIDTHPSLSTLRNNASAILAAIDEFGRTHDFLMTLGPAKREVLVPLIAEQRPKIVVDVGAYVGDPALMLGGALVDLYGRGSQELGKCKVFSFEKDPMCAAVSSSFVELAGLKGVIDVVFGKAAVQMRRLKEEGKLERVDLLLLDHWEKLYVEDLKVVEELGFLKEGSVIVADNVVYSWCAGVFGVCEGWEGV